MNPAAVGAPEGVDRGRKRQIKGRHRSRPIPVPPGAAAPAANAAWWLFRFPWLPPSSYPFLRNYPVDGLFHVELHAHNPGHPKPLEVLRLANLDVALGLLDVLSPHDHTQVGLVVPG